MELDLKIELKSSGFSPVTKVTGNLHCSVNGFSPRNTGGAVIFEAFFAKGALVFSSIEQGDTADNPTPSLDAVIHMQESPPHNKVLDRMQLTRAMRLAEHLTALRALVQAHVCLVGENPTCSVPALQGCEGLWPYD